MNPKESKNCLELLEIPEGHHTVDELMLDQDEATENNEDMLSGSDPPPESTVLNTGTVIFSVNYHFQNKL